MQRAPGDFRLALAPGRALGKGVEHFLHREDGRRTRLAALLQAGRDQRVERLRDGLATGEQLHPLQEALRDCHSFQCGFCTPGFVMTAVALLEEGAGVGGEVTEEELREELSGNLCRCTGYQSIVAGVAEAVRRVNGSGGDAGSDAQRVEEISR